jgi:hypothetical protein
MELELIWIAIAAFIGALIAGYAGWLGSGEVWDSRKFGTTVLTAIGAAVAFALLYQFTAGSFGVRDILSALAGGIGLNTARVYISRAITLRALGNQSNK